MNASSSGFQSEQNFSNGGSFVKSSFGSARSFNMSWNGNLDSLQVVKNFKDGLYGGGLLYWEDPFATNILPPHWAAPMLTVRDWPSLISSDNKPTPVTETTSGRNLPYQSAKYEVYNTTETSRSLTLLIPEKHFLRLGFVYTATGTASIKAIPIHSDNTEGTPVTLAQMPYNGTTLYDPTVIFDNDSEGPNGSTYPFTSDVKAVRIYISKSDNTASTITIRGGIATYHIGDQVAGHNHPAFTPAYYDKANWSPGQGFTGCVMTEPPSIQYNGIIAGQKLVQVGANLKEVEAWL
jgi:hypothetical protein